MNRAWGTVGVLEDILKAVGVSVESDISCIAHSLRTSGAHQEPDLYTAVLFIGDDIDATVQAKYPASFRRSWNHVPAFVHDRSQRFASLKTQVDQWDRSGQSLMRLAQSHHTRSEFVLETRKVFFLRSQGV